MTLYLWQQAFRRSAGAIHSEQSCACCTDVSACHPRSSFHSFTDDFNIAGANPYQWGDFGPLVNTYGFEPSIMIRDGYLHYYYPAATYFPPPLNYIGKYISFESTTFPKRVEIEYAFVFRPYASQSNLAESGTRHILQVGVSCIWDITMGANTTASMRVYKPPGLGTSSDHVLVGGRNVTNTISAIIIGRTATTCDVQFRANGTLLKQFTGVAGSFTAPVCGNFRTATTSFLNQGDGNQCNVFDYFTATLNNDGTLVA